MLRKGGNCPEKWEIFAKISSALFPFFKMILTTVLINLIIHVKAQITVFVLFLQQYGLNGLGQTWSQVEILGRNLDFYKK